MAQASVFGDYIDWRSEHPSDDLMTELMTSEFRTRRARGELFIVMRSLPT